MTLLVHFHLPHLPQVGEEEGKLQTFKYLKKLNSVLDKMQRFFTILKFHSLLPKRFVSYASM